MVDHCHHLLVANSRIGSSEALSSKAKIISKPKNSKSKVVVNSESKAAMIKIMKKSEPVPQNLIS